MSSKLDFDGLSKGDRYSVDPGAIERELAALWTQKDGKSEEGKPVTRACLWNVVVHSEGRAGAEGQAGAEGLRRVMDVLPQHVASRGIILQTDAARDEGGNVESWISANCALSADGSKLVCSEEITVASYGDGDKHLTALVHSLLVPDVPIAALFAGVPPREGIVGHDLVDIADRIIVRVDGSCDPNPLGRLTGICDRTPKGLIDLGWLAQSGIRSLVAELFEPPATDEDWQAVDHITVRADPSKRASAKLHLGWIANCLGATEKVGQDTEWTAQTADGRTLRLKIEAADTPSTIGISRVELSGGHGTQHIEQVDERHWRVAPAHGQARPVVLETNSEAELLASALRSRGEDASFVKALNLASQLK